jgi:Recombination endonuclease VII
MPIRDPERRKEFDRVRKFLYYKNMTEEQRAAARQRLNEWREKNREYRRLNHRPEWLRLRYGLTLEQYDEILASQNGVCAICEQPPGKYRLCVDHNHATKARRGLLCHRCNTALARLEAFMDWETRARAYLNKHGEQHEFRS